MIISTNKILRVIFLAVILFVAQESYSQNVEIIKIGRLESILNNSSDTTFVINFWASWCGPCIKELPIFEKASKDYANEKVKILLINLDNITKLDSKVMPILLKNHIKTKVYLLNESDSNSWIDKIDPNWSGALPYTMITNDAKKSKTTIESALSEEELKTHLKKISTNF